MNNGISENPQLDVSSLRGPDWEQATKGADAAPADSLALDEINPYNPHLFAQDRFAPHFARLRREDPVHLNELDSAGRYWSITKYDDIKTVSADWKTYSSASGFLLGFPVHDKAKRRQLEQAAFIAKDGAVHDEQRRTVQPAVAPRHLRRLEPLVRERTRRVLSGIPRGEVVDWVDLVSIELTTMMLATLFDFPFEDRRMLTRWSDILFALPRPGGIVETREQKLGELQGCIDYFKGLWEERRKRPGDDLVSLLVHGEATRDMPPEAHLGNLLLLIVGGNDTTRNTMSGGVYALDKWPEEFAKLVSNPDLIPNMVAEIIRWQTPLAYMRRTATRDSELRGKQILEGDQLLLWYVSANRDEDVFEDGERVRIDRRNARYHLSFGYGPHFCMGSRLAELQLQVLWEEILESFESIEVQEEPTRTLSTFVKGYNTLPVIIR